MSPRRSDRVAPPAEPDGWEFRYANNQAAEGWEDLCRQAAGSLRRAYREIVRQPAPPVASSRQHRLRPPLHQREFKGTALPQWQYEVTGGAHLWYLVDTERRTIWLWHAGTAHPRRTE